MRKIRVPYMIEFSDIEKIWGFINCTEEQMNDEVYILNKLSKRHNKSVELVTDIKLEYNI